MFEKWADKKTKLFSKKAVEHAKEAIVEDVKENKTGYIMAGITGLVIAAGVLALAKAVIGAVPSSSTPAMTVTINYYITVASKT